jgi:Family of unknown function (DUF5995)
MAAQTIDQVLQALDGIIGQSWQARSRNGYFAALYRRVTQAVKDGIAQGRFQNGPLMETLDVVFASRYLDAANQLQTGGQPAASWQVAFNAASDSAPLILQQLLAGMNAHINLDLGIASAEVAPGDQIETLQTDFFQINQVLAEQVSAVEQEMAAISPMIHLLEDLDLRTETQIINFNIDVARDLAWAFALRMAVTPSVLWPVSIAAKDAQTALFGQTLVHPGPALDLLLAPIRLPESDDIRRNIEVLAGHAVAGASA